MKNKSISDKEKIALYLAWDLGYNHEVFENNLVWYLIDFGYQREHNIINGHCSLLASIDFKIDIWEKEIEQDIKNLREIYQSKNIAVPKNNSILSLQD